MKVVVSGSRVFGNPLEATAHIVGRITQLPPDTILIHGSALFTDRICAHTARVAGLEVISYPADWHRHGKRAGIVRNGIMLDQQPDLVLVFWNGVSKGTKHMIDEARRRKLNLELVVLT